MYLLATISGQTIYRVKNGTKQRDRTDILFSDIIPTPATSLSLISFVSFLFILLYYAHITALFSHFLSLDFSLFLDYFSLEISLAV